MTRTARTARPADRGTDVPAHTAAVEAHADDPANALIWEALINYAADGDDTDASREWRNTALATFHGAANMLALVTGLDRSAVKAVARDLAEQRAAAAERAGR